MSEKIVVVCPHCGSQSTYDRRLENGTQAESCHRCRKGFRIELRRGSLWDVR